jgi:hypothetical protein
MEKITNYFQLNKFIKDNINTQKYKNSRNLTIDSCNISEKVLLKYISKSYMNNGEDSMFRCYSIRSYFNTNLIEIKKVISSIKQETKLEVIILLVNLSDEDFENLTVQNKEYYLYLINIKDYNPEVIPSWKEQILSVLILSSPLGYLVYKYYNVIRYYIEKIYNEIFKFFVSDGFIIVSSLIYTYGFALVIAPLLIYWMFKAFALRIKYLLPLSSLLYALNTILILYLNLELMPIQTIYIYLNIFASVILIPSLILLLYKMDSIFDEIVSGESNIIDPITYFKNRKNKKEN